MSESELLRYTLNDAQASLDSFNSPSFDPEAPVDDAETSSPVFRITEPDYASINRQYHDGEWHLPVRESQLDPSLRRPLPWGKK